MNLSLQLLRGVCQRQYATLDAENAHGLRLTQAAAQGCHLKGWQPRQVAAVGSWFALSLWQDRQVARSPGGEASCERWQAVQVWCFATRCRPGSCWTWWQVAHAGGLAGPDGPCGRWQLVHETFAPWPCCALSVWQLAHAGRALDGAWVASLWQFEQSAWPCGAVCASA